MTASLASASSGGLVVLAVSSFLAGAVNAVAGGGTLLTFPVLVAILPPDPARMVIANATSTVGLWPASVSAAWAYRGERLGQPPWATWLLLPSVAGAVVGVVLLLVLPPAWFEDCVPWLILAAAVVFAMQPRFARLAAAGDAASAPSRARLAIAVLLQFLVAVYGGYFGAGIGILMLAALGTLGLGDIHRVNAVKNTLAMAINGVAAGLFALGSIGGAGDVSWTHVVVMAAAAVCGSWAASRVARSLPAAVVRRGVAVLGFVLAARYFLRS